MVWLIYHQSECQEVLFSSIFLALQRMSLVSALYWNLLSLGNIIVLIVSPDVTVVDTQNVY